ncbi:MAG: hypothetical protein AB7G13_10815 [Lautropia sp.]
MRWAASASISMQALPPGPEPAPAAPGASQWCWHDDTQIEGLRARPFRVKVARREVPGVLWIGPAAAPADGMAPAARPRPLVLVQHGGSGHKADPAIVAQLRPLVVAAGFLAATIDGPIHGERADVPASGAAMRDHFLAMWARDNRIPSMVEDWLAVVAGLSELADVDATRIGWMGTSMGTAYGLPVVAACPVIKAAVLGKWAGDYPNSERLREDAPAVRCAVLFIQRWDDELFSRAGTLELFDRLGCSDKRLHVYPGSHFQPAGEPLDDAVAFLRVRLGDAFFHPHGPGPT